MRSISLQATLLAGIIGAFGSRPVGAQEQHNLPPAGAVLAQSTTTDATTQREIRALRAEMERLQQRIEQLEQRPSVESHATSAASATPTLATAVSGWPDALKHFTLSTLIYGDWSYYPKTGWGPQFLTQLNPPGPGNDHFNSFDITRTYINLLWTPSERYTIRLTPNIFREVGTVSAFKNSSRSSVGSNINGNLTFRLKYGWFQINDILYEGQHIRVGQLENPLIPWEEDLYGFRFVNLVPLNFFAYSSTDLGVAALGPIRLGQTKYGNYWFGLYNGSSFHAAEFNEKRSPQGRVTLYPFARVPELAGFGLTSFGSYGYTNVAPDTRERVIRRLAALVHYNSEHGGLAFEFDDTLNNNNVANFFSGSGPLDQIPDPAAPGKTVPNPTLQLYTSILNPKAIARGYSLFGHWDIPKTPFTLFGMWTRWYPNIHFPHNPLDSDRIVFGAAYRANSWLRVALDTQNFLYLHHGPSRQQDIHAVFANFEINYQ